MGEVDAMVSRVATQLAAPLQWENKDQEMEMLTRFYVIALSAVIESWVMDELNYTPEELIAFADKMLSDQIRGVLIRLNGLH
jgi:hypothetical protein